MTVADAINKVTELAKKEEGYLEKKSNAQLDSKTANAGRNNYTKYWRDLANWGLGNFQAQWWCAGYIHWLFVIAFGLAKAAALLLLAPFINCEKLGKESNAKGQLHENPKAGDIALFWNGAKFSHTEFIYKVTTTHFYTSGGNTGGGSSVIANGGGVFMKSYSIADAKKKGHRFHRPDYKGVLGATENTPTPSTPKPTVPTPTPSTTEKYIVKKGDSLSAISKKFDVTVDTLVAYNGIKDKNMIYVGQILVVKKPTTATAKGQFKVQVSIKTLRIRKGAGTNYTEVRKCPVGVHIITETKVSGGYTWGKLLSGEGWIALEYAKKL